jgi:hypothetical protein
LLLCCRGLIHRWSRLREEEVLSGTYFWGRLSPLSASLFAPPPDAMRCARARADRDAYDGADVMGALGWNCAAFSWPAEADVWEGSNDSWFVGLGCERANTQHAHLGFYARALKYGDGCR